jgi:CBS domain-containing protein
MPIGEICSRDVVFCHRNAPVRAVAELMRELHVGAIVVVDEANGRRTPAGVVTDRDIVVEVVAAGLNPEAPTAGDIMGADLITAREDDGLSETLERMRAHGIRRVPVVDAGGALAGILSVDDVIALLAEEVNGLARLIDREQRKERDTRR